MHLCDGDGDGDGVSTQTELEGRSTTGWPCALEQVTYPLCACLLICKVRIILE